MRKSVQRIGSYIYDNTKRYAAGLEGTIHRYLAEHFRNLGVWIAKHTTITLLFGYIIMFILCIGLTKAKMMTSLEKLWIDSQYEVDSQMRFYNRNFGGFSVTESTEITGNHPSVNAATSDALMLQLDIMKRLNGFVFEHPDMAWGKTIDDKWGVFHVNISNLSDLGFVNLPRNGILYGQDLCEEPSIPIYAYAGLFADFAQCWPGFWNSSADMSYLLEVLPKTIRFPCVLIRPIDCFQEGGFDYLYPTPSLSFLEACPFGLLSRGGTCTGGNVTKDNMYDWIMFMSAMTVTPNPYLPQSYYDIFAELMNAVQSSTYLPMIAKPIAATATDDEIMAAFGKSCVSYSGVSLPEAAIIGGVLPTLSTNNAEARNETTQPITFVTALRSTFDLNNDQAQYDKFTTSLLYAPLKIKNTKYPVTPGQPLPDGLKNAYFDFTLEYEKNMIDAFLGTGGFKSTGSLLDHYKNIYPNLRVDFLADRSANDAIKKASTANLNLIIASFIIMAFFVVLSLINRNLLYSRMLVGLIGVIQVAIALIAAFGFSSWIGMDLNPLSTQVLPFLALGLGVDDMFVIVHSFPLLSRKFIDKDPNDDACEDQIAKMLGQALFSVGASVTTATLSNVAAFGLAAIVPLPAVQSFTIQALFVMISMWFVNIFCLPVILVWDAKRQEYGRADLFCCLLNSNGSALNSMTFNSNSSNSNRINKVDTESDMNGTNRDAFNEKINKDEEKNGDSRDLSNRFENSNLDKWAKEVYGPFLFSAVGQAVIISISTIIFGLGIYGCIHNQKGLTLAASVPNGYVENFFSIQDKYFALYPATIVFRDFHHKNYQSQMRKSLSAFQNLTFTSKGQTSLANLFYLNNAINDFGILHDFMCNPELPDMAFIMTSGSGMPTIDRKAYGGIPVISYENFPNIWKEYLEAIGQTVSAQNNPCNSTLVMMLITIPPEPTYTFPPDNFDDYMLMFVNTIGSGFYSSLIWKFETQSPCVLYFDALPTSKSCVIPSLYSSETMAIWVNEWNNRDLTKTIKETERVGNQISKKNTFGDTGSVYAYGVVHLYWSQYVTLDNALLMSLGLALLAVFVISSFFCGNVQAPLVMIICLVVMEVEIYGFLYWLNLTVSAMPVVNMVMATGVCVENTLYIMLTYIEARGSRRERVLLALQRMLSPMWLGSVATFLAIVLLNLSTFPFMRDYYFKMYAIMILFGVFNGLALLPLLLYYMGPVDPDRIKTMSEEENITGDNDNLNKSNAGGSRNNKYIVSNPNH